MAKVRKIDFGSVPKEIRKGGGRVHIPEGDYKVKILEPEFTAGKEGKAGGYRWHCQVTEGPHKGKKLTGYTSLAPDALWSLRNLIHAATGKNVAGKALNFDPDKLVGKVVGAAVEDNEYTKGDKTYVSSQINTFFPKDEIEEVEEEEEDEEEDEEVEEEEEDEELEDVEVDEL